MRILGVHILKQMEIRKQKLWIGFQVKEGGDTVLHGCASSTSGENKGAWRSSHDMARKELTSGWMG